MAREGKDGISKIRDPAMDVSRVEGNGNRRWEPRGFMSTLVGMVAAND